MPVHNKIQTIIIDDDEELSKSLEHLLTKSGCLVARYNSPTTALANIETGFPGVIICDYKMKELNGLDVLTELQQRDKELPVILMTAHGDVPLAVEAIRQGAYDFVEKPYAPSSLLEQIRRAAHLRQLTLENRRLRAHLQGTSTLEQTLIGDSEVMQRLREDIINFAASDASIMIVGETGVGKEIVARSLHELNKERSGDFIAINCSAIAENIFESELFGHVAGAFTDARGDHTGYFQAADKGTLFLDEVTSLPLHLQPKLLRVLEERQITKLGTTKPINVNIRFVSASNETVSDKIAEDEFRDDLYYRLNTLTLFIPPLRERGEDVLKLFDMFLARFAVHYDCKVPGLSADQVAALLSHNWPGNVRELRHVAERFLLTSRTRNVSMEKLIHSKVETGQVTKPLALRNQVEAFEKLLILRALERCGGNMADVTDELQMPRRTLNEKMQKYGLNRTDFV